MKLDVTNYSFGIMDLLYYLREAVMGMSNLQLNQITISKASSKTVALSFETDLLDCGSTDRQPLHVAISSDYELGRCL